MGLVYGCVLFDVYGGLLYFIEDVGCYNVVDVIVGFMWFEGMEGGDKIFYIIGCLIFEMVIKGV